MLLLSKLGSLLIGLTRCFLVLLRTLTQFLQVVCQLLLGREWARAQSVNNVRQRDGLLFEQLLCELLNLLSLVSQQALALCVLLVDNLEHFVVDHLTRALREGLLHALSGIVDGAEAVNHAVLADDTLRYLRALLDVVTSARSDLSEEDLLSDAASESNCNHITQLVLRVQ